jgi:site-specific recombinase
MQRSPDAHALLDRLDPDAPLAQRHLWLMAVLDWVRGDRSDALASARRVVALLDAAEQRTEWLPRWQRWWSGFHATVDVTPLLADHGFAPRTAFLSELGNRLRRKLLPATPETTDIGPLFDLLFPYPFDVTWLRALDGDTLARIDRLLELPATTHQAGKPLSTWQQALLDATVFSASQVSATGFAAEIRVRMSDEARHARHFHALPQVLESFRASVLQHGVQAPQTAEAAAALRQQLDNCRHAAYTVYSHLEAHGISVGIVFRLRQLRERILRIKGLIDCLLAEQGDRASAALLADLVQVGQESRSVRQLIATSSHLTAARVAERSAESGEHYITRNMAEYRAMLAKAAGGGAIIGLTTWAKFALYSLGLSAFWMGFAAGFNYAASFVLVQLLHLTVATKQPAVTAPAMVAKLRDLKSNDAVRSFVDEVAHLFRSQVAAIVGNVGLVVPVVLLISALLLHFAGAHMINAEQAHHVLHDLNLVGPTALFAAFTGVLLFASSIIAGWVENWFVLHRLDSAMTHHPHFTRALGVARAARWAGFMRRHISGFASNISLGFLLGLIPAFAAFFGLGLEVRHVTLSAGQVAAAAATLGLQVLAEPAFWWAVAGVVVVGPINLGVSFYLAFRLALKAQNINQVNRERIRAEIRARIRSAPLSFLWPPREDSAAAPQTLPPQA